MEIPSRQEVGLSRIAFIGLGMMGLKMARHLVAAGHELVACDLDPERARALGTATAPTPAEAVAGVDVAITSLPAPAAVEAVVLEVATAARPGAVVIEMSTSPPSLMRRLAAALEPRGIDFLDAPVSGGPAGAEAATLAIMVGGRPDVFDRHRDVLGSLGKVVVHAGEVGAGQVLKLCNNLIVAVEMVAIAEACAILVREGIDPALAFDVFTSSTSDSTVLRRRFPLAGARSEHPSSRGFEAMFALDLLHKDLTLGLDVAADAHVEAPVAARTLEVYDRAQAAGHGRLDYSAVYLVVRP